MIQSTALRLYKTSLYNRSILRLYNGRYIFGSNRNITTNTANSNQTILKYDPTDEKADFTTVGVLPFLQKRLNEIFKGNDKNISDFNVQPTEDQRNLLSILNSEYSVLLKGSAQSGKSLSTIIYAINYSLSRVPNFGILKKKPTVDSIILAPTDGLLKKYKNYAVQLTKDIPTLCCPHEITKHADNDEFVVTRRPLVVEIIYGDKSSEVIQSGPEETANAPHILITTPNRLFDIMNSDTNNYLIKKEYLNELRFFAVDEMEFHMTSTGFSNSNNFLKQGKKGKSISYLEKTIKQLQTIQIEYFINDLEKRLKTIEFFHKKNNNLTTKFNHAKFVLERDDLSVSTVSDVLDKELTEDTVDFKHDLSLIKKLIKHKRKVLYKPVQYCFISTNAHHYAWEVQRYCAKASSLLLKNPQMPNIKSKMLNEMFYQYLEQKEINSNSDLLTRLVERIIRFDDSKRKFRKQERKLLSVGTFNLRNNRMISKRDEGDYKKVNMRFLEIENKKKNNLEIKDITFTQPTKLEVLKILENEISASKHNLINSMKDYLKLRVRKISQMRSPNKNMSMIIKGALENFRSEFPLNTSPSIIVVPPYINKKRVCRELNKSDLLDKFSHINSNENIGNLEKLMPHETLKETEERINLIVHAEQLIGQSPLNCKNIIIMGIDCLIDELAFSSSNPNLLEDMKVISSIELSSSDLLHFYIAKLLSSSNYNPKYLTFVMNNTDNWCTNFDYQRLSQILLYNEIWEGGEITTLSSFPEHQNFITFGCNELYFNHLKIENRKKL